MAFRKFTDFGAGSRNDVTLRVNQSIFISNSILYKCKAVGAKYVYIFVDDEKPLVGIKFIMESDLNDKESRKLSIEKSGVSVNISPILKFYNIDKQKEKKNLSSRIEEDMLIIDFHV